MYFQEFLLNAGIVSEGFCVTLYAKYECNLYPIRGITFSETSGKRVLVPLSFVWHTPREMH